MEILLLHSVSLHKWDVIITVARPGRIPWLQIVSTSALLDIVLLECRCPQRDSGSRTCHPWYIGICVTLSPTDSSTAGTSNLGQSHNDKHLRTVTEENVPSEALSSQLAFLGPDNQSHNSRHNDDWLLEWPCVVVDVLVNKATHTNFGTTNVSDEYAQGLPQSPR